MGVTRRVVGIDVGGTKIAAGVVDLCSGVVSERRQVATDAARGADAVLASCLELARSFEPDLVGLGVCELVDLAGRTTSAATIDWRERNLSLDLGVVAPCAVESDVRAAALAEARFGAGAGHASFLYVTISTGIAHALVIDGAPWGGSRGNAIVLGSPPVEDVASGVAIAASAGRARAEEVVADATFDDLVAAAAEVIGNAIGAVLNATDPEALVVGGGLGLNPRFLSLVSAATRRHVWAPATARLPILPAALGADAGIVGAALAAARQLGYAPAIQRVED